MQGFDTRPQGDSQTSDFCVALTYKGITILSSMRLEFKSLSDSELITYLMKLVSGIKKPQTFVWGFKNAKQKN